MKELKNKIEVKSLSQNKNVIIISYFFIILSLLIISCKPIVKSLGPLSSTNMEDSRKEGLYLFEYYPLKIKLLDTISLQIKEVFAEKQFRYQDYNDLSYIISRDKSQVIIVLNDKITTQGFLDVWKFDNFNYRSPYRLCYRLNSPIPPDSLLVKVLKVDINENGLAGKDNNKEIGSFVLRRK